MGMKAHTPVNGHSSAEHLHDKWRSCSLEYYLKKGDVYHNAAVSKSSYVYTCVRSNDIEFITVESCLEVQHELLLGHVVNVPLGGEAEGSFRSKALCCPLTKQRSRKQTVFGTVVGDNNPGDG